MLGFGILLWFFMIGFVVDVMYSMYIDIVFMWVQIYYVVDKKKIYYVIKNVIIYKI